MNLIEHYVAEVLSEPYQVEPFTNWFVRVSAFAYGRTSVNTVMVKTYEEALLIDEGYVFDA